MQNIHTILTIIGHRFGHQSGLDESSRRDSTTLRHGIAFRVYFMFSPNSPGLGPGRVRSSTFCFYCNICYVCKATFTFFIFCCNLLCVCLATFATSAIVVVHCLDNCCLLFRKCAHEGGCQGAPGLPLS